MDSNTSILDDAQYRRDVLLLASEDVELARAHRLADEAHQLGLKVPEIEVAASLTASLASGMVDLSLSSASPILSSGSSTCDGSSGTTPASSGAIPPPTSVPAPDNGPAAPAPTVPTSPPHEGVSPLDQVTSSLSELTVSSRAAKSGSIRSMASMSTRPTSFCSSDGRWVYGHGFVYDHSPAKQHQHHHQQQQQQPATNRNSMASVVSGEKKTKRRASLMSAIGKIPFRRKRTPSSVLLPPEAQITVSKGELGEDKVYVESKKNETSAEAPAAGAAGPAGPVPEGHGDGGGGGSSNEEGSVMRLEIPVFDHESLQRSLVNPEMVKMRESHWLERNRHVAFQDALMNRVRCRQQASVASRLTDNKRLEDEKREQNAANAARMEERQLAVEMEQQREFERAKQNARTRIKHMEGYFNTRSPPSSPGSTAATASHQPRQYTEQQKAQLAQEYHFHRSMDQLHESKIKVLRERQERRLFEAGERMDNELDDLVDKHTEGFAELQKQHQQEEASVLHAMDANKTRLRHRWNLEEAVQRRKLELQHEVPYGPLPPLTFSDSHYETRDSAICVSDNAEEKQHQH